MGACRLTKTPTMFALFCVGTIFALAFAVTLYAFAAAKDGYEDQLGFHLDTHPAPQRLPSSGAEKEPSAQIPPFAAAG